MKRNNEELFNQVSGVLKSSELPSEDQLEKLIHLQAEVMRFRGAEFTSDDLKKVKRHLQNTFDTSMNFGSMLADKESYRPWLNSFKETAPNFFYWDRYRRLLENNGYPRRVVLGMDEITDEILDHLEDPRKTGNWARRGLIMGHVQSGKTANYTGLICKAADAGYKVVIVLAGILNSLRSQTQERIDEGFLGFDSDTKTPIGVSSFSGGSAEKPPCFTNRQSDFDASIANQVGVGLDNLKQPAVFVIKKNVHTLKSLHRWLKSNNRKGIPQPLLMIDDEADHASVNTSKPGRDATAINGGIRKILDLFPRHCYVGYTATPFANIFIDSETDDKMAQEDLFPRDFIRSLDAPDNYFGTTRIFGDNPKIKALRPISDNEDFIPLKHRKDFEVGTLPPSLKHAIRCFIIACSIRNLREHSNAHKSMMVNCSRFTAVQNQLAEATLAYLKKLQNSCKNYHALSEEEALTSHDIHEIKKSWEKEYNNGDFEWEVIQKELAKAALGIDVLRINASSPDRLDYSKQNYPSGRSLIAIGGTSLSRGLTLEGLCISYFIRNSIMYDTLMQMGRWFGYRTGYEDICRIFMQQQAIDWYSHISTSIEELRDDLTTMAQAGSKPDQFGLRVRSHPDTLIVTARNKMNSAQEFPKQIELDGRRVETGHLYADSTRIAKNKETFIALLEEIKKKGISPVTDNNIHGPEMGIFWRNVPSVIIEEMVMGFENHPASILTSTSPIIEQLSGMANDTSRKWDVLLRSTTTGRQEHLGNETIKTSERKLENNGSQVSINKSRVGSTGDERAGLTREIVTDLKKRYEKRMVPDWEYRAALEDKPPLLTIYPITQVNNKESDLFIAYAMSFPVTNQSNNSSRKARRLVTYTVNPVWIRQYFGDDQADEEEETDES
jgi:hypothetical protein